MGGARTGLSTREAEKRVAASEVRTADDDGGSPHLVELLHSELHGRHAVYFDSRQQPAERRHGNFVHSIHDTILTNYSKGRQF